jgi:hypothetical protein
MEFVNRVASANLANSNFAAKDKADRQICGGPRLGYELGYGKFWGIFSKLKTCSTKKNRVSL